MEDGSREVEATESRDVTTAMRERVSLSECEGDAASDKRGAPRAETDELTNSSMKMNFQMIMLQNMNSLTTEQWYVFALYFSLSEDAEKIAGTLASPHWTEERLEQVLDDPVFSELFRQ